MNSSNNTESNSAGAPFGKHLSREEISALQKQQNVIPEGLDDFDKDALQGWQKASAGMELMQPIDRRFMTKSKLGYYIAGALVLALIGLFFLFPARQPKPNIAQTQKVTVNKSDVVISEDIKKLEELPEELQITPQQMVSNFKSKQQEQEQTAANPDPDDDEVFMLPLKKIQLYSSKPKLTIEKEMAKEIYLSDLKLVDYRAYRTRPEIPSEQITFMGTSADQEKKQTLHDNPEWKSIDIPYHDYLSQTMEQFKAGNFKQALNRANAILEFYPNDINALFYGGLCYYNLSEMDQAVNAFQQVIANQFSNFDEEALWYLANAYDLKNDKVKAKELFQAIVAQKGYYAKQAEKMLRK